MPTPFPTAPRDPAQGRRERERLELLGRTCAGLAHDVNNALTIITGNLQVALDEEEPERLRQDLRSALDAAWSAAELTRLSLDLASPRAAAPRPLRVRDVAGDLERAIRLGLGTRVTLSIERADPDWQLVEDPLRLVAAVLVLALHVGEGARGGTHLALRFDRAPDEGEPCARLGVHVLELESGARRARAPLSLELAEALAADHGGRVETSGPAAAERWARLVLPLAPAGGRAAAPGPAARTVLLVEDDEAVARALDRTLGQLGLALRVVPSAEEALERLEQEAFALVVTDVAIGGELSGLDLVARLRRLRPELPVLLCTGQDLEPAAAAGVPLLRKPFGAAEFRTVVSGLLGRP